MRLTIRVSLAFALMLIISVQLHAQAFIYTNNSPSGNNTVSGYRVNTDGSLTSIGVFGTGGTSTGGGYYGSNRANILINGNSGILYVSNQGSDSISAFSI